jgi:ATP synthase protein I
VAYHSATPFLPAHAACFCRRILWLCSYHVLLTGFLALAQKGENALEKKPQKDDKRQRRLFLQGLSFLSQIGITMAACVLVGVFLGRYLDRLLNTSPWFLLLFSFLGAGAAFKSVFDLGSRK